MKTIYKLTFAALAATLLFQLSITRAHAGQPVPFKATFHGFAAAATPTDDPDVFEIVVPLQGTATHLGKFDELLVHYINFSTYAFTGRAYWTAANGDTFTTVFEVQLYPTDDPALLTFDVIHTIVEGTGRFNGATGSFNGSMASSTWTLEKTWAAIWEPCRIDIEDHPARCSFQA